MSSILKRVLVGPPIPSSDEHHTRLGRPTALTVFASDAVSSTAYATEEILLVLMPVAGVAATDYLPPISIVVALLLTGGPEILLPEEQRTRALVPIERMLEWSRN